MRQRVKDSPEELLGEDQFFIRGCAKAAHARGKTVVLPVLLVVVGQELETDGTHVQSASVRHSHVSQLSCEA